MRILSNSTQSKNAKANMKLRLLLLFMISMTVLTNVKEIRAKERKGIVERISKNVSRTRASDRINRSFEWMIGCVNILGQLDNFISDRTKNIIQKVHAVYNEGNRDTRETFNRRTKRVSRFGKES